MPTKSDDLDKAVGLAVEVLNRVEYGGKVREPSSALQPTEFAASDSEKAQDPLSMAFGGRADPILGLKLWGEALTDISNLPGIKQAKTYLIGGDFRDVGGSEAKQFPGLLNLPQMTVEATGLPQLLHEEQMDMGLLEEDTMSRRLLTDPLVVGPAVGPMSKALKAELMESRLGFGMSKTAEGARNAVRWGVGKAAEEGSALNIIPQTFEKYKAVRDGARIKWTGMYDAFEDAIWNKALGSTEFTKGVRDFLAKNFQTNRAKFGDAFADGLMDVYASREIAKLRSMPIVRQIRSDVPLDLYKDLSRYVRPRVVGGEKVWPAELGENLKGMVDEMSERVVALNKEGVDLKVVSPNVAAEYEGNWYPRRFEDRGFLKESTRKQGPLKRTFFAKDAPGIRVKMTKEEAEQLMQGTGDLLPLSQQAKPKMEAVEEWYKALTEAEQKKIIPIVGSTGKAKGSRLWADLDDAEKAAATREWEALDVGSKPSTRGSALEGTDLTKGRAELDPIYSGQEGSVTLIKFSPKDYGTEEAARAARDEFAKRATNLKYKVLEKPEAMTEAELLELGEQIDPATNIFEAQAALEVRNAKGRLFRTIAEKPEYALTPEDAALQGVKWKELPKTMRWGELSGMHVRPDIYRQLTEFDSTLLTNGQKIWKHIMRNFKSAKTIWSPATTVRNFFGNVPFAYMADATPPWAGGLHNYKYYRESYQALRAKEGPLYEEMVRRGIVGTQYSDAELKILEPLFASKAAPSAKKIGEIVSEVLQRFPYGPKSVLTEGVTAETLGNIYNFMDTIYRGGIYTKARRAWNWTDAVASAHVNKFTPNYLEVGDAIRRLRESPLGGPFASFGAESVRILRNGIRERPLKTALVTAGAPYIYSRIHKAWSGMTDSEYEAIRSDGPMTVAWPTKNDEGQWEHIPLDFWSPWGWLQTGVAGNKYTRREARDAGATPTEEAVMQFAEFAGPFIGSSPAFTTMAGAFTGIETFSKRKIQREGESWFGAYGKWLAGTALPELTPKVGRKARMVEDLMRGRKGYKGKEMDTGDTLRNAFLGLQTRPYDTKEERMRWGGELKWAESEFRKQLNVLRTHLAEGRIFQDEYDQGAQKLAQKYSGILRNAKERLFLAKIVEAERDIREGRTPRWSPEELKQDLEDTREERDMPGLQKLAEGR